MATQHDLIARGGTVLDGTGGEPFAAGRLLAGASTRNCLTR